MSGRPSREGVGEPEITDCDFKYGLLAGGRGQLWGQLLLFANTTPRNVTAALSANKEQKQRDPEARLSSDPILGETRGISRRHEEQI